MVIKLTLGQDNGAEVTSLIVPIPQSDYWRLSDEQLAAEYLTPYLNDLRLDGLGCLLQAVCPQDGQFGPA